MEKNNKVEINDESLGLSEINDEKNNKKFKTIKQAIKCLLIFSLFCGIIYPLAVTIVAQTMFPYQANGSQIVVTMKDGTKKIYGSELIGQNFENPQYMFGRVNTMSPSNLSPESEEYKALLIERIATRKEKLAKIGYTDTALIPDELLTSSGSGVDPHISLETAYFQVEAIIAGRKNANWKLIIDENNNLRPIKLNDDMNYDLKEGEILTDYTKDFVNKIIKKYSEGRFLGIFGQKHVNVLFVNLALDGLI